MTALNTDSTSVFSAPNAALNMQLTSLGDPELFAKLAEDMGLQPAVEAISPDGKLVGLTLGSPNDTSSGLCLLDVENGQIEMMPYLGEDVRIVGITADGLLVGRVDARSGIDSGRRPFIFRKGMKKVLLLDPPVSTFPRLEEDPPNHTPLDLFSDGSILGWTHSATQSRESFPRLSAIPEFHEAVPLAPADLETATLYPPSKLFENCLSQPWSRSISEMDTDAMCGVIWQRCPGTDTFRLSYLPKKPRARWYAPSPGGQVVLAHESKHQVGPISFQLFDGEELKSLGSELLGMHLQLLWSFEDGGFCGRFSITQQTLEANATALGVSVEALHSDRLSKTGEATIHFVWCAKRNRLHWLGFDKTSLWPEGISPDGKCIVAFDGSRSNRDREFFLLERGAETLQSKRIETPGWRLDTVRVSNSGTIIATARCIDSASPQYRLLLPTIANPAVS